MKTIKLTVTFALFLVCSGAIAQNDFVRGDKVIFEDNLANEKVGSRPSKWEMCRECKAIVTLLNDEKAIQFPVNGSTITAVLNTPNKSLPENCMIELEFYVPKDKTVSWLFQ